MPLNPNIALQVQPFNAASTFNNLLSNIGQFQNLQQQQQLAPLQQQILQGQLANQQQQSANDVMTSRIKDLALLGSEVKPLLDAGNIEAARNRAMQYKQIVPAGGVRASTIDEFINTLDTNPALAGQYADQAIQLGQQFNISGIQGATSKQRELEAFRNLPESTDEERVFKEQYGKAIGAIEKTPSIEEKIRLAKEKGDIEAEQKLSLEKRKEQELVGERQRIEQQKISIDETRIKNEAARQQAVDTKNIRRAEADNAIAVIDGLLSNDKFSSAFGRFNNAAPEGLRSQENIDTRAQVDQILGLVSLESREKLKGQGTITDSEAATLAKSATILANPLISDDLARKELRRVKRIFEDASDRNILKQSQAQQPVATQQPVQIGKYKIVGIE